MGRARVALVRASDFYGPRVTNSALGERVFPAHLREGPGDAEAIDRLCDAALERLGMGTGGGIGEGEADSDTGYQGGKGVAIFTHTGGGLMYEASIGGQKFKFTPRLD